MPWKPKAPCRKHRRLRCTDPECNRPRSRQRGERRLPRPDYTNSQEVKRRRDTVREWLSLHGITLGNGDVIARCPDCHQMRARFVADHVVPIAEGGAEDGELRVHCSVCSGRQGAMLSARKKRGLC